MKNDINYYMSEVKVPPEIEKAILKLDMVEKLDLGRRLSGSLENIECGYHKGMVWRHSTPSSRVEDRWLELQSRDTWVRVLRWLAMEAI